MISFTLKLKALTLLTVGWNIGDVLGADVLHVRKATKDGLRVYIPGSSVKGSLRSAASRVADIYGFSSCKEVISDRICRKCDVCKLFGYPDMNFRSPLVVSDFNAEKTETITITRVSIDDKTLIAKEGELYTTEHILPGTEFSGTIKLANSAENLLPLLLLAIAELRIGRFGRRSIVDAKIEGELRVDKKWVPLLNELKNWLWEDRL